MNEAAATIAGELGAERNQSVPVPVDDGGQRIDHEQRSDLRVLQHGPGGVAEPESADHDIEMQNSPLTSPFMYSEESKALT